MRRNLVSFGRVFGAHLIYGKKKIRYKVMLEIENLVESGAYSESGFVKVFCVTLEE